MTRTELDRLLTGFTQQEPRLLSASKEEGAEAGAGDRVPERDHHDNNKIMHIIMITMMAGP